MLFIAGSLPVDDRLVVIGRSLEAEQFGAGSGDRADPQSCIEFLRIFALVIGVVDEAGNRIQGVTGLAARLPVLIEFDGTGFIVFVHIIGVAVVGGNDHDTASFRHGVVEALQTDVERAHGDLNRLIDSGMSDHIPVREVQTDKLIFSGFDRGNNGIGDLGALHPGTLFKRNDIGGDLLIGFKSLVEFSGPVSVEEVGDMTVLLRFTDCKLTDIAGAEILAERLVDLRRINQIMIRDMEVAVVFHHAGIEDFRHGIARELVEIGIVKRLADLDGAVAAEVEVDDDIAVFHGTDRSFSIVGDHKRRQILVDRLFRWLPQRS